ncbi:porin [Caballeronia sp. SEWSISQ10-4 2]|uniref:porin n=1 Tax=Caballeronia sp. SEWSISQ10-4 2 TaxID=2937438 RepID=UPI00264F8E5D|nr:porin [Caballeronia sp. SEWSISQ10-4 2]MDN7179241.1 porin [Caballeronia sp. SEWSISQ10-4 2]
MKKSIIQLALPIILLDCAHAQSTVTLYGAIDSGINYTNNVQIAQTGSSLVGGHQIAMLEGGAAGLQGSRWGFRGTEDLGDGLKTLFVLESGFDSNSGVLGQGGSAFGRQAYVGLSSAFGTVTLGRQYDAVVDLYAPFLAARQWGGLMAFHPGDVDNALNSRRINNSIKYRSVSYRGLTVEAIMNLGGIAGSFSSNWIWGGGVAYATGPFSISATYLNVHNPNTSFYGSNPDAGPSTTNNLGVFGSATGPEFNPVYAGYASANRRETAAIAAGVTLGSLNVNLAYSNTRFEGMGSASGPNPLNYSGTAAFNNIEINSQYQLTPSLLVGAAYDYTRNGGAGGLGGANYDLFSTGTDYFLSKRTDVYTVVAYEKASGTDSFGQSAVAEIGELTPSTTNKQVSVRIGIRHRF